MLELVLQRFSPDEKEAKDEHDADEEERQGSPLSDREFPPPLIEPM
jgi:hypothetical protein